VLIVSHYLLAISCKKYNYTFEFVKVMSKVLSVPFFPDTVYNRAANCQTTATIQGIVNRHRTNITVTRTIFAQKFLFLVTESLVAQLNI